MLLPLSASAESPLYITAPRPAYLPQSINEWQPERDRFVVDTEANMGYLIHPDGRYLSFRVATGRRSIVRYIGRVYNAATPETRWTARKREIQGDRVTFDDDGVFFRLYKEGTKRTPYGIHSTLYIEKMLSEDDRFKSMGCVLVNKQIRSFIERSIELNGGELEVITVFGLEKWDEYLAAVVRDAVAEELAMQSK